MAHAVGTHAAFLHCAGPPPPRRTNLNIESGGPAVTSTANSYAFWERTTSPSAPCRIVRREPAAEGGRKRQCMLGGCKNKKSWQAGLQGQSPWLQGPLGARGHASRAGLQQDMQHSLRLRLAPAACAACSASASPGNTKRLLAEALRASDTLYSRQGANRAKGVRAWAHQR